MPSHGSGEAGRPDSGPESNESQEHSEKHNGSEESKQRLQDSVYRNPQEQRSQRDKQERDPVKRQHSAADGRKYFGECEIVEAQSKGSTNVESSCRKGVTDQAAKNINKAHDKADYDTLTHFNDTNCHAATQRKMRLEPTAGGATMMNESFMKEHGYNRVSINATEQLKEGDVVATPIEQKLFGIQLKSGEWAFGHSGVAERDPESGKMMITEKLGPSTNYLRQSPEAFAQTWTPEGGFAKNQDIWVYRKGNASADTRSGAN